MSVKPFQSLTKNIEGIHIQCDVQDRSVQQNGGDQPPDLANFDQWVNFSKVHKQQVSARNCLDNRLYDKDRNSQPNYGVCSKGFVCGKFHPSRAAAGLTVPGLGYLVTHKVTFRGSTR